MDKVTMKDIKKEGKDKENVSTLRKPVYQVGDGIVGLENAVRSELKNDTKVKSLIVKLNSAYRDLRKHLTANYLWD